MFSNLIAASLLAVAMLSGSTEATPVRHVTRWYPKFTKWHGIGSLENFDDFYGRHNFNGHRNRQVIVKKEKKLVCRRVDIKVIQQRLVVIQELAKRVISEQICEVETQTIVFQQWHSGLGHFKRDLHRRSGKQVGYDEHIASLYHRIINQDGHLTDDDLGFKGHEVGSKVIIPEGNNWDVNNSPPIVDQAQDIADAAANGAENDEIFDTTGVDGDVVDDAGADAGDADDAGAADITGAAIPPAATGTGAAVPPIGTDAGDAPTATGNVGIAAASGVQSSVAAAATAAPAAGGEIQAGANVGGAAGLQAK